MKNGITTIIQWAGSPVHHFEKLGYGKTKFCDLERKRIGFLTDA